MKPGNYLVEVSNQRALFMVPDTETQNRVSLITVLGVVLWVALAAALIIALRRRAAL